MPAFSSGEVANVAAATLDWFIRGQALSSAVQAHPLLEAVRKSQATFAAGGGSLGTGVSDGTGQISLPVKGAYTSTVSGYQNDDTVTYVEPNNLKRALFRWKEHHTGIQVSMTELKANGISVVDTDGRKTSTHSKAELAQLVNLLEDKIEDMTEGWARGMTLLLLRDGTGDAKALTGLRAILADNNMTGTGNGGINRATEAWWRHRARTAAAGGAGGLAAINTGSVDIDNIIHTEIRQLRRFGGRPNIAFAGSDFLDALAAKLRSRGQYTQDGWTKPASTDISMADIRYQNINFVYEPAMDDESRQKFCYILDTRRVKLHVMEGEDMKQHNPARSSSAYVIYRAVTWTGQLTCNQANANGVYEIV